MVVGKGMVCVGGFWYVWGEGIVCVRVGILDLGGNFRFDGGCMQAEAEWFVGGGA